MDWPCENICDVSPDFRYYFLDKHGKPALQKEQNKHDLSFIKRTKAKFPFKKSNNDFDGIPYFRAELSVMLKNEESACSS